VKPIGKTTEAAAPLRRSVAVCEPRPVVVASGGSVDALEVRAVLSDEGGEVSVDP
jgi:hypothetical protein